MDRLVFQDEPYHMLPNIYIDRCMGKLSSDEMVILWYIARRTVGFGKRVDRISLSQFEDGITLSNGKQLDNGTGLSKNTIRKCLQHLKEVGLVVEIEEDKRSKQGTLYMLQSEIEAVRFDLIDQSTVSPRDTVNTQNDASTVSPRDTTKVKDQNIENKDSTLAFAPVMADRLVPKNSVHQEMMDVYDRLMKELNPNFKITNGAQVGKRIRQLMEVGCTPELLESSIRYFRSEEWRTNKVIELEWLLRSGLHQYLALVKERKVKPIERNRIIGNEHNVREVSELTLEQAKGNPSLMRLYKIQQAGKE